MKNSDILNALCSIDEEYLDKSFDFDGLSSDFRKQKNKKLRSVCAICCCIAVGFTALGVAENGSIFDKPQISASNSENNSNNHHGSENYLEKPWNEQSVTGKFPRVIFNNAEYCTLNNEASVPITHEIDRKIGEKAISATDNITGKMHSIKAKLYSLKNISPDCIIALEFEGYKGLYSYINTDYSIAKLEDLISALDLKNTLMLGSIEDKSVSNDKNRIIYSVNNQTDIWEHLLSKPDAVDLEDKDITPLYDITVNLPSLGIENKALIVSADGYIQTNILEVAHTFYIGEEAVNNFKEYVSTLQSSVVSIDASGEEILE